jgi:hypothetical protein
MAEALVEGEVEGAAVGEAVSFPVVDVGEVVGLEVPDAPDAAPVLW